MKKLLYPTLILLTGVFISLFTTSSTALDIETGTDYLYAPEAQTISMDFRNAPLNDVLKIFSQQSDMNFVAATEVADKSINLYLDNVPVEAALERILFANGLTYEITPGSNIFVVKELRKPEIEMLTKVYPLKHASVSSSKIYSTITIGESTQVGEDDGGAAPAAAGDESAGPTSIRDAITALISEGEDNVIGAVVEDARTNSLIVTTTASRFPLIDETIARLDVRIPQILIETEMMDITEQAVDLLGAKFGDTPIDFFGAQRSSLFPFDQNNIEDDLGGEGLTGWNTGTLSFRNLSFILQFLRTQTDTKSLARPRILTLNNETAEISIATNEAIGANAEIDDNGNISRVEAEREQTGVFLTVTPQANIFTREITLAIEPRVIQAREGAVFFGVRFRDPESRGSRSLLRVMDGDTVIIGGLLRYEDVDERTKVPIISDIPILGSGFRHKDKNATQRELIIFITPHIVKETIAANFGSNSSIPIVREQNIPRNTLTEMNREMAGFENRRY